VLYPSSNTSGRQVDIVIDATNKPVGYIDCAKIVVGKFWEPTFNFENGVDLNITDSSTISTTNAGEVVYDRGYIRSKLEFKYALLNDADKNKLVEIFKECGIYKNILVSLFPTTAAEQTANEALYTI